MRIRYAIAATVVVCLAALAPGVAPAAGAGVVGPLHTAGNKIYDGRNRPIILRGVVAEWLNYYPTLIGSFLDDNSIGAMQQWGARIVRVPLGQQYWVSSECEYFPSYAGLVDQVVQSITGRGMVALLDLHWSTRETCGEFGMQRMPDQRSITFWSEVAARYKNNPLVAFELYNEPHDVSWNTWRNGGYVTDPTQTPPAGWVAPGMQQLYNVVRSTGARNLVFVSGVHYSSEFPPDAYLISGYNIVYGDHSFMCGNEAPPLCPNQPGNPANDHYYDRWVPFIRRHPVVLAEFGWPDASDGTYNRKMIAWAERRGIGWVVFDWAVGAGSARKWGILSNPLTFAPNGAGIPVEEILNLHRLN
jgi:aryl-phospho-beta-D-glucosidase BglC (GH1 family)